MEITECAGYKKILFAVERDETESPNAHDYRGKLEWIVERARHYAQKTGLDACDILNAWEERRDYWYMNYYQDCNQPIALGQVRVFNTPEELEKSIGEAGFRCPRCGGASKSPYACDSGLEMEKGKVCDWKTYGLFGHMGKGIHVFVKSVMRGDNIFMPLAWETATEQ